MPKVTQQYRTAKRDEIAQAALACIVRQGFAGTSMADIIDESGVSAGSIYSHFAGKAEIARYVAADIVGKKIISLGVLAAERGVSTPSEVIAIALERISDGGVPPRVIVQMWSEATTDPDMLEVVQDVMESLRDGFAMNVLPWARAHTADEDAARDLARRKAVIMTGIGQGFIAASALWRQPHALTAYVDALRGIDAP